MGYYKYIKEMYKHPKANLKELWRERLIKWRKTPTIVRLEKPTRIDKARSLGYKAKKGYIVVRIRVPRGGRQRETIRAGRRSKHFRSKKIVNKSYQWIAEERAARKFKNCEVLNSYEIIKDGKYFWYEILLLDREVVKHYDEMGWVGDSKGRVFRGKTASGMRTRGMLTHKGTGTEKTRPSLRSHGRRSS